MNEGLKGLAMAVRDLMGLNESFIQIGRTNEIRETDDPLLVIVDFTGDATPVATGQKFDGDAETMTIQQRETIPATVDFYGDNAYEYSRRFRLLLRSQSGWDIQFRYGVTLFNVSAATNLKSLSGTQYSERYQLRLNVGYNVSETIDTLRIDTAVTSLLTN